MKVITNNNWRNFLYRFDVPEKVLQDDFDYQSEDIIDGFIKYRGSYYHLDEFLVSVPPSIKGKWMAYRSDSFFSGLAINVSDDGERYQIALILA